MNLRLLLWEECDRACAGCCNRDWDLARLPVAESFAGFDMVMLTGGEPLLHPELVLAAAARIRAETPAPIVVYTAMARRIPLVLNHLDGATLTLHGRDDVKWLRDLDATLAVTGLHAGKSLRLNVFAGVDPGGVGPWWQVKAGIRWIRDCPLPHDEVFMRWRAP